MVNSKLKIIFEDSNILVVDKPAGIVVSPTGKTKEKTLIDLAIKEGLELKKAGKKPRYGLVHRIDKETSGILLIAKNNEILKFLQGQFKKRKVLKKYLALVSGKVKISSREIKTQIGRANRNGKKQKVYLSRGPKSKGKREAITRYKILEEFDKYTLLEVFPKTGRKHQIRVHLSYINHPVIGDKKYGFKNQLSPKGLNRMFLHASLLKINVSEKEEREFKSPLPKELNKAIENIKS